MTHFEMRIICHIINDTHLNIPIKDGLCPQVRTVHVFLKRECHLPYIIYEMKNISKKILYFS